MDKIIKDLYYGSLEPEQFRESSPAEDRFWKLSGKLWNRLKGKDRKLLGEITDSFCGATDGACSQAFCAGVRLGARLTLELLDGRP